MPPPLRGGSSRPSGHCLRVAKRLVNGVAEDRTNANRGQAHVHAITRVLFGILFLAAVSDSGTSGPKRERTVRWSHESFIG
jgi:hypothetical protein